jgi:hypothetical protein
MNFRRSARVACAAAVFGIALAGASIAQQQPTPTAMLLAKELVEAKSAMRLFNPLISGVIEYHRNLFTQTNPNLGRELSEVAQQLHTELVARRADLEQQIVRIYAQHFTEQELKQAVAFYRTPLGKKLIAEEPKALDESMKLANEWSSKLAEEVIAKMRAEMKKRGPDMI